MERGRLRQKILGQRNALPKEEVWEKSRVICQLLRENQRLQEASVIMAYAPIRNEVDITSFWWEQFQAGKTILLPRVQGGQLAAIKFSGWDKTRPGPFGIKEPIGEPFLVEQIEVVLVPGVVFDHNGYRLGYGRGFYDRFLPQIKKGALRLGVAYDFQMVENTFPKKHDFQLDTIITEMGAVGNY